MSYGLYCDPIKGKGSLLFQRDTVRALISTFNNIINFNLVNVVKSVNRACSYSGE